MKNNNKASSLIIAIWLSLVMSVMALYLLEYIVPFSNNTKNIEQSVWAYYMADSAIEEALYSMNDGSYSLWQENTLVMPTATSTWYSFNMTAKWDTLPPTWQWDSEDKDFNIISIWKPIQIEIWNNTIDPDSFKIFFRIPDLNDNIIESLANPPDKIINWQLSWQFNVLNSSNSQITSAQINWSLKTWENIFGSSWSNKAWLDLNDASTNFSTFYSAECWLWDSCILKMSIINNLKLDDLNWTNVPYLEWKIESIGNPIPLRYTIIDTTWKYHTFKKFLQIKVPQQTLNEAFDFTVFQ